MEELPVNVVFKIVGERLDLKVEKHLIPFRVPCINETIIAVAKICFYSKDYKNGIYDDIYCFIYGCSSYPFLSSMY